MDKESYYNNPNLKKFLSMPINYVVNKIKYSVQYLSPIKNDKYCHRMKYTIEDYIIGIIQVLNNCISWNRYIGLIKGDTLRKKHNDWVKLGIYDHAYKNILNEFLTMEGKTNELKYQSIDSTFIEDVNGNKNSSYSGIYKKKKGSSALGITITSIVTKSGIPISITLNPANNHDSTLLPLAVQKIMINCNTYRYRNHNRYKQYFLTDKGYDSKNNMNLLIQKGYNPLISQNIRNTKDRKLIRNFNIKQKNIYKNRIKIENYHSWIKKFHKIKFIGERKIDYYMGLLLLAVSIIMSRRIVNKKT